MSKRHRARPPFNAFALALALSSIGVVGTASSQTAPGEFEVAEQVSGRSISLAPAGDYRAATLVVVGPGGYRVEARFDGGPLDLDLTTGRPPGAAESDVEAASRPLPVGDGRYRWEARFWVSSDVERVVTGSFSIEGGVVLPRPTRSARRAAPDREESAGLGRLPSSAPLTEDTVGPTRVASASYNVDDILFVVDQENDKQTAIQMTLGNTSDGYDFRFWDVINDDGLFRLDYDTNFAPPGSNKLSIDSDGRVGLNTITQAKRLHVRTTVVGDGIRLENDTVSADTSWDFSVDGFAGLNIQDAETGNSVVRLREGAPTDSLVVSSSGDVGVGTALPTARLHVVGSGVIEGDVALGSSRTIKHALVPLDPSLILAAVRDLPLYRWKYKEDPAQASHVGPMAEDVHSTFSVGRDERHLSPADTAGLALAAVQGIDGRLDAELEAVRAENARLAAENRRLREAVERIGERLEALASAPTALGGGGPRD